MAYLVFSCSNTVRMVYNLLVTHQFMTTAFVNSGSDVRAVFLLCEVPTAVSLNSDHNASEIRLISHF